MSKPMPFALGNFIVGLVGIFSLLSHVSCGVVKSSSSSGPPPLSISTSSLPLGQIGTAYSTTLTATGGTPPYTWSISSGQLPPGLTVAATSGAIEGTPSQAMSSAFTVQVADSASSNSSTTKSLVLDVTSAGVDQYGGLLSMPSPNPSTGNWRLEKFGSQWWFVDPLNNAFHFVAPFNVGTGDGSPSPTGTHMTTIVETKYNATASTYPCYYVPAAVGRLQAWGYTGVGDGSMLYLYPWDNNATCWTYDSTLGGYYLPQQYRMPTVLYLQSSGQGMVNRYFYNTVCGGDQPVKMVEYGINSSVASGEGAEVGSADFADSRLYSYAACYWQNAQQTGSNWFGSPARLQKYAIGMEIDEADNTGPFVAGGDHCGFTSTIDTDGSANGLCTGKEHPHGGMIAFRTSPLQYANRLKTQLYPVPTLYLKETTIRNYLTSTYGTVAALNSAWGTSYSDCDMEGAGNQFGSCGTQVTGESFGTGNGGTAAYNHTLANLTPSEHSVGLYVNGNLVAGDLGCNPWESDILCPLSSNTGKLWGPLVNSTSSTIDYTTGAMSVTFQAGAIGICSVSGSGTVVTVQVCGTSSLESQHGTWVGAHVTISGTTNYNMSGVTVASIVDARTFTISSSATGAASKSGTVSFTDTSPGASIPITVSYVTNGWGLGNGVMDEDGRGQACFGSTKDNTNQINLYLCNAAQRADFENILGLMATDYFQNMDTEFTSLFGAKGSSRTMLNFGPGPLTYWGSPSHSQVIAAAGKYLDVIEVQSYMQGFSFTQARLDAYGNTAGDVPLLNIDFICGQPDSAMRGYTGACGSGGFLGESTQASRGAQLYTLYNGLVNSTYTAYGDHPWVGSEFWQWTDQTNQNTNFGLVSPYDNAYDGHEDVTGTVPCSPPLQAYTCGSNDFTSGNFITPLTSANQLWLTPQ